VAEIAAARHRQHQIVTAVRTQAGTLKLIGWNVGGDGSIDRTGDSGGAATFIDIARNTTDSRFITACRSGSSRLFLISWNVNESGNAITRLKDSGDQAGNASMIRIAPLGNNRFVTACRDGNGNLLLIGWLPNNDGSLTRLKDSSDQAGAVQDIALVTLPGNRVVTAVCAGHGHLLLITWAVDATGRVQRLGDSGEGDIGDLAGETLGHDISLAHGAVVTGIHAGNGNLKVILWNTAGNGSVSRVGDSSNLAGSASLITQCEELTGAPPIITSVRTAASSLKLIAWSRP